MAIPVNIEKLIRQRVVESSRIEYKADWNAEPIIHSIAAFANDFVCRARTVQLRMLIWKTEC